MSRTDWWSAPRRGRSRATGPAVGRPVDEARAIAAEVALRLGELASRSALAHDGRVVKLLGDGVLMRFPNVVAAVDTSPDLLDRLEASDLPAGHVGVTEGPVIGRDGDIFG